MPKAKSKERNKYANKQRCRQRFESPHAFNLLYLQLEQEEINMNDRLIKLSSYQVSLLLGFKRKPKRGNYFLTKRDIRQGRASGITVLLSRRCELTCGGGGGVGGGVVAVGPRRCLASSQACYNTDSRSKRVCPESNATRAQPIARPGGRGLGKLKLRLMMPQPST